MEEVISSLQQLDIQDERVTQTCLVPTETDNVSLVDTSRAYVDPTITSGSVPPLSRRWVLVVGGMFGFLVLVAGLILKMQTPAGTVILEIDQPELIGAVVQIDGEKKITITTGTGKESIEIVPDEKRHLLEVKIAGYKTFSEEFSFETGNQQTINVRLEPLQAKTSPLDKTELDRTDPVERNADAKTDWISLFDGSDTSMWQTLGGFSVVNMELIATGGELAKSRDEYADFELEFDWRISAGGNGGVYYRERATQLSKAEWRGTEYQLLDNELHANGQNPRTRAGSLYGEIAPQIDATKPIGQFNTSRIVARGGNVTHWMNGQKLLEYDLDRPLTPFHPQVGAQRRGFIYLQGYSGEIAFKRIRIRKLNTQ